MQTAGHGTDSLLGRTRATSSVILAKRFELLELAGRGGMGEVHRAIDLRDGSTVAVKTLPAGLRASPRMRALLDLEAAALDGCRARGVPRLVAQGRVPCGAPFIVMSW